MSISSQQLDRKLDRLIDGELSSSEYRELLATLDEQPQGWRRCALAFLEAQALGGELAVLRGECLEPVKQEAVVTVQHAEPAVRPVWQNLWFLTLAMAASFLIALPLGPLLFSGKSSPDTPVAKQSPLDPAIPPSPVFAQQDPAPTSRQPLGNIRLVDNSNGSNVEVPYYHADNAGDLLGSDTEVTLSPELLRALELAGNNVQREQSMMPLNLEDGGQVLVPIDRYRISPVKHRVMQ